MKKAGTLIFTWVLIIYALSVQAGEYRKVDYPCTTKAGVHRGAYIHDYIAMYRNHAEELGLSAEQMERLRALDSECRNTCDLLSAQIEEGEAELDALLKKDELDTKTLRRKIWEIHAMKADLELNHFELLQRAQKIMNSEQRKKCRELCRLKTGSEWPMTH